MKIYFSFRRKEINNRVNCIEMEPLQMSESRIVFQIMLNNNER